MDSNLCVDTLCVDTLCVDTLCVDTLCVDTLCVDTLCVDTFSAANLLMADKNGPTLVEWTGWTECPDPQPRVTQQT